MALPSPILNDGIVPGGVLGSELQAVTRRAVAPYMVVQIYQSSPLLSLLMKNAQKAKGGLNQITVPVQGSPFVTGAWTGYDGSFQTPAVLQGAQNCAFNLKEYVVPIPFLGNESIIQSSEVIVPLAKARMADAKQVSVRDISTAIFANNSAVPNGAVLNGLQEAYDSGTNVTTYGGISRTTNTFWASNLKTSAGNKLTRAGMFPFFGQLMYLAGGEAADVAFTSVSDWTTLATDFIGGEQYQTNPKSQYGSDTVQNSGFRGIMIGDTPVFADMYCPKGTMYLVNSRYLALYLSEDAAFNFSGFYSTIPNYQIGALGVVVTLLNLVCTKPVSGYQITGLTNQVF